MELSHLRYFQAVARAGSITGAAREVGVSQPSISAAIKTLETRLGTRLLQRTRDGVTLTETGQALLASAEDILERVEDASRRIEALENEEEGRFVLGCYESLGAYFLPTFLRSFLRNHPRIRLQLWNGSSAAVRQAVLDRVVDVGLVVNTLPHADLVIVPAFEDRIEIVSLEDPAADLDEAHARLVHGPLIHADRPVFAQIVERLAARGAVSDARLVCGDLELVKSLALGGVGPAILPRRVAAYGHPGRLRCVHPELPSFADTIHLVWRADLLRTRAARTLKDALLEAARAMEP